MEILNQKELENLYNSQQKGKWEILQRSQPKLKQQLLENFKANWADYKKDHQDIRPIFSVADSGSQEFLITGEIADEYNIKKHLNDFLDKSQNSTAGIRAFVDVYNSENPQKMYNDMFLAILIEAEAEFLKQVHEGVKEKFKNIGTGDLCRALRKNISRGNIGTMESIYDLKLEGIIELIRSTPIRLVGGEVRAHTAAFVEMETRILAENGIKVITLEKYSDTTTIYMFSFLCYLLGATGATYYTPSHSSNYVCGRKVLAADGSQILPDVYENYRIILNRIVNEDIYGNKDGYKIRMSERKNSNILNTITYDKMAKLYSSIVNITGEDVSVVNKATKAGHKIVINALNGSSSRTLKPILSQLGIDLGVFEWVFEEEDQFFNTGYAVVKLKDKKTGKDAYNIEHLGVDTTMASVVNTIPYPEILENKPLGTKIYECDPDSDRFVIKQIMDKKEIKLLDDYAIGYSKLNGGKILAALSPNKVFLCLDIVDYELMKSKGIWDNYVSLYIITYVSWRAWGEFADAVRGLKKLITLVGFKNVTAMQKKVEDWYFGTDKPELFLVDSLGNEVLLDRKKPIRIHCKEEESGGRVAGMNNVCYNLLGEKVMSMPEKSVADSLISELIYSSKLYLDKSPDYTIAKFIDNRFKKYGLASKVDFRLDIVHGTPQGVIAQMGYEEQQLEMEKAKAIKANFNNFFFSVSKAFSDGAIDKEKASGILSEIMPAYADLWSCIDNMIMTEELLAQGKKRPEGALVIFKKTGDKIPLVNELDFRPSGTDPLKSKVYGHASVITPAEFNKIKKDFEELAERDLYGVLEKNKINSVIEKK